MAVQSFMDVLLSRIDERIANKWAGPAAIFKEQKGIEAREKLMYNLEMLAFSDAATTDDVDSVLTSIEQLDFRC